MDWQASRRLAIGAGVGVECVVVTILWCKPVGWVSLCSGILSWFPVCPRFRAGPGLFQEAQYVKYTLGILEDLLKAVCAAVVGEMLVARGCVQWAVQ
jgi:hypothetical protein